MLDEKDHGDRGVEVRFCPVCGSTDIDWVAGLAILAPYSECKGCGYRGVFIVGNLELVKKVRETYRTQKNEEA